MIVNRELNLILFLGFSFLLYFLFLIYFLVNFNYLPVPFHNIPNDTFADFYNVNIWANNDERYTSWNSIYPPLTFLIAKVFNYFSCDFFAFNDCYKTSFVYLFFLYVFGIFLLVTIASKKISFQNLSLTKKLNLVYFLAFCLPILYLVERGNYLLIAFILYLLLFLYPSRVMYILIFSLLVNLKPYLFLFGFFLIQDKNYNNYFYFLLCSLLVFVSSSFILDDPGSLLFIFNSLNFSANDLVLPYQSINYQMNFDLFFQLAKSKFGFSFLNSLYFSIKIFSIFLYFYVLFKKRLKFEEFSLITLLILMIISYSFGGYLSVFLIPLIFFVKENKLIFYMLIFLFIPFDFPLFVKFIGFSEGFISEGFIINNQVERNLSISIFAFLRPIMIHLLLYFSFYRKLSNDKVF